MTTQSISNSIKWTSQKASPWSRVRLREWGTRWCHIFGEAAQLSWIRSSGICIIPEHRRRKAIHFWLLADDIGTTRTLEGEGADCGPGQRTSSLHFSGPIPSHSCLAHFSSAEMRRQT
jgi:hypothetical protein